MDNKIAIKFEHVTKEFNLLKQKTFKEFLPALMGGEETKSTFKALGDVSFEVKKGETLGVIGPNGSGKSTILKLIAGVMYPTKGKVKVRGKVSPLIELGAGFHPELTGRENVYLNGAILGLKRSEIDENFKSIVDFAELWEFIDQPIKHYSSGMYMRLAFAVAVHTNPEILIVDEILAVGDSKFQQKCLTRMMRFKKEGKTIVLVTHDLSLVRAFCDRVVIMNKGKDVDEGLADYAVDKYVYSFLGGTVESREGGKKKKVTKVSGKELVITGVGFTDDGGRSKSVFLCGDAIRIVVGYRAMRKIDDIVFGIAFYDQSERHLYGTNSLLKEKSLRVKKGKGRVVFEVKSVPVLQGRVLVTVAAHTKDGVNYDWVEKKYFFDVFRSVAGADGVVNFNTEIHIDK